MVDEPVAPGRAVVLVACSGRARSFPRPCARSAVRHDRDDQPEPGARRAPSRAPARPEYATQVENSTIGLMAGAASMNATPAAGCTPRGISAGDRNRAALAPGHRHARRARAREPGVGAGGATHAQTRGRTRRPRSARHQGSQQHERQRLDRDRGEDHRERLELGDRVDPGRSPADDDEADQERNRQRQRRRDRPAAGTALAMRPAAIPPAGECGDPAPTEPRRSPTARAARACRRRRSWCRKASAGRAACRRRRSAAPRWSSTARSSPAIRRGSRARRMAPKRPRRTRDTPTRRPSTTTPLPTGEARARWRCRPPPPSCRATGDARD